MQKIRGENNDFIQGKNYVEIIQLSVKVIFRQ